MPTCGGRVNPIRGALMTSDQPKFSRSSTSVDPVMEDEGVEVFNAPAGSGCDSGSGSGRGSGRGAAGG